MTQINVRNGSRPAPIAAVAGEAAIAAAMAAPMTQAEIDATAAKPMEPLKAEDAVHAASLAAQGVDAITDTLISQMESACRRIEENAADSRKVVEEFKARHAGRGRAIIDELTGYAADTAEFSTLIRSMIERGNGS